MKLGNKGFAGILFSISLALGLSISLLLQHTRIQSSRYRFPGVPAADRQSPEAEVTVEQKHMD
ncbi:MAG: hypothetical protein IKS32_01700 [Solobacterium sp.]|nr:hypothetical protein [Solobacterium sp.]